MRRGWRAPQTPPNAGDSAPQPAAALRFVALRQNGLSGQSLPMRGRGRRLIIDAGEWRLRPSRLRVADGAWRITTVVARRSSPSTAPHSILKRIEINVRADLDTPQPASLVLLITYTLLIERHNRLADGLIAVPVDDHGADDLRHQLGGQQRHRRASHVFPALSFADKTAEPYRDTTQASPSASPPSCCSSTEAHIQPRPNSAVGDPGFLPTETGLFTLDCAECRAYIAGSTVYPCGWHGSEGISSRCALRALAPGHGAGRTDAASGCSSAAPATASCIERSGP